MFFVEFDFYHTISIFLADFVGICRESVLSISISINRYFRKICISIGDRPIDRNQYLYVNVCINIVNVCKNIPNVCIDIANVSTNILNVYKNIIKVRKNISILCKNIQNRGNRVEEADYFSYRHEH